MKTTLHLDDRVAKAVKRHAETHGTTLTAVINTALRQFLARSREPKKGYKLELQTRPTGALPGVDIENRDALYDLMDDR